MRWSVPQLFPQETLFLVAGGPSLMRQDLSVLKGRRVIAINNSYRLLPSADVLWFTDHQWWRWHHQSHEFCKFRGLKVTIAQQLADDPTIKVLHLGPEKGLSLNPEVICHGSNSGYAALNLAVLLGASRVVLLGYDMQVDGRGRKHWHQDHRTEAPADIYETKFLPNFPFLVKPLAELGVEVVNATPGSALKVFPMMPLDEVLAAEDQRRAA